MNCTINSIKCTTNFNNYTTEMILLNIRNCTTFYIIGGLFYIIIMLETLSLILYERSFYYGCKIQFETMFTID